MFGYGFGEIVFGPLSDRFGRRGPLLVGVGIYIVATALAVFSPNFGAVLFLRLLQGIGAASTRVVATSVVRDRFSGHAMAEVMSLIIMLFMAIPILAPGAGQFLLMTGPWEVIFIAMTIMGMIVGVWTFFRLPESLNKQHRRPLTPSAVLEGFSIVMKNRAAFAYGLAGMFMFASLFGFLNCAQQIYVGIYQLGPYFPVAFACVAALMGVSSFYNSRLVAIVGMRRLSHTAVLLLIFASGSLLVLSIVGTVDFWGLFPFACYYNVLLRLGSVKYELSFHGTPWRSSRYSIVCFWIYPDGRWGCDWWIYWPAFQWHNCPRCCRIFHNGNYVFCVHTCC